MYEINLILFLFYIYFWMFKNIRYTHFILLIDNCAKMSSIKKNITYTYTLLIQQQKSGNV